MSNKIYDFYKKIPSVLKSVFTFCCGQSRLLPVIQGIFPSINNEQKPYEWMIIPTRQQQWIDDKGVFLWLGFFFSEIGASLYFLSLFYEYKPGLIFGWVSALILGGGIHILYLGNPLRAWRMIMKPNKSELSRGIYVIGIFAVLGFLQIISADGFNIVFKCVMGVICLLIISHGFVTMNVIRALPAWSSTMVLPLSIISGVWVGQQILQFMFAVSGSAASEMEIWAKVFFLAYVLCILLYVWGTYHNNETARTSIKAMLKGELSKIFYLGVCLSGILMPLIAGDLALRYVIMKSAVYKPLI